VAVADLDRFESFAIDPLQALPSVMGVESHITMKLLMRDIA
jgi:hypothetical protein